MLQTATRERTQTTLTPSVTAKPLSSGNKATSPLLLFGGLLGIGLLAAAGITAPTAPVETATTAAPGPVELQLYPRQLEAIKPTMIPVTVSSAYLTNCIIDLHDTLVKAVNISDGLSMLTVMIPAHETNMMYHMDHQTNSAGPLVMVSLHPQIPPASIASFLQCVPTGMPNTLYSDEERLKLARLIYSQLFS